MAISGLSNVFWGAATYVSMFSIWIVVPVCLLRPRHRICVEECYGDVLALLLDIGKGGFWYNGHARC